MKTNNKFLDALYNHRYSKSLVYRILKPRARDLAKRVSPYLGRGELILDIGSASCTVPELLRNQGLKVFPLDVENFSIVDTVSPTIYDGHKMPFRDGQFDTSLILFVLHHTYDPTELLIEAGRVSRKMIILEDIITSPVHGYLTAALDSLINLEFFDEPHSNKRDVEWQAIFRKLGFKLLNREYKNFGLVIKHALYVLEK